MSNWAWQPTEASLIEARDLVAGSGSYTLTGSAANLLATNILVAAFGSYALTGIANTATKGRTLVAERGEYSIFGSAVDVVRVVLTPDDAEAYVEHAWVKAQAPSLDADWTRDMG